MFKTKILQAVARLVRVRDHLGRPGTEVLDASDLHARVMDIDPVIVESVAIFQDQHDGQEIAILERVGGPFRFVGDGGRETVD